ncbi:potassium channel family protein [Aquimarina longa]|uniref:potassium channel family protein n=1 Tax=Aquimarina longa TaxID=1080221 RepID=UPI000783D829|nr:potassium channel protein [Aquimarina longa]
MRKKTVVLISGLAILYNVLVYLLYIFESRFEGANIVSLSDAYWYSLVTLTTVGYGDFYPITFWGRTIGFLFLIGSLGILGVLVTELSLIISNYVRKKKEGYFGTIMEDHYIIIGWDNFSQQVAEQIISADKELAIISDKREDIDRIKKLFPRDNCFAYLSDLKDYSGFSKVNIEKANRVYLNFKEDSETLVYMINLKKIFPDLTFVITLEDMDLKSTFTYMGVDFVISRNEIASKLIASYIFEPKVALFAEDLLATSKNDDELDIWEKVVGAKSSLIQKNYLDVFIEVKKKYNAVLLGVSRGNVLHKNPENLEIEDKDILIFISNRAVFDRLEKVL